MRLRLERRVARSKPLVRHVAALQFDFGFDESAPESENVSPRSALRISRRSEGGPDRHYSGLATLELERIRRIAIDRSSGAKDTASGLKQRSGTELLSGRHIPKGPSQHAEPSRAASRRGRPKNHRGDLATPMRP